MRAWERWQFRIQEGVVLGASFLSGMASLMVLGIGLSAFLFFETARALNEPVWLFSLHAPTPVSSCRLYACISLIGGLGGSFLFGFLALFGVERHDKLLRR